MTRGSTSWLDDLKEAFSIPRAVTRIAGVQQQAMSIQCRDCLPVWHCHGTVVHHVRYRAEWTDDGCTTPRSPTPSVYRSRIDRLSLVAATSRPRFSPSGRLRQRILDRAPPGIERRVSARPLHTALQRPSVIGASNSLDSALPGDGRARSSNRPGHAYATNRIAAPWLTTTMSPGNS